MPRPSASPRIRIEARIAPRALPRSLMSVYYLDERKFRELAAQLEKEETFSKLVSRGLIERVRYRGNIPQHRYEEYKDQELVEFFRKYPITQLPDWQQDFLSPGAVSRRHQLAKKYKIPLGPLTGVLRYMSYMSALQGSSPSFSLETRQESPDFLQFTAAPDTYDTAPYIERIRRFSERAGLSADEFQELFLACKPRMDTILERVSAPAEEVTSVLEALEKIQLLNSLHFEMKDGRPARKPAEKSKSTLVAEVARGQGSYDLELRFLGDDLYDVKYRFNSEPKDAQLSQEERDFLEQLKAVNQRKTVLCRIVSCLFRHQYRFLMSANRLQMEPLTQAQVARELQEEEATVSRLIRDKRIGTPEGEMPLKSLFRKVADLVKDLIALRERRALEEGSRSAPFTDTQMQKILLDEYGVKLSRRAITYHRNRTQAGLNFYARSRQRRVVAPEA